MTNISDAPSLLELYHAFYNEVDDPIHLAEKPMVIDSHRHGVVMEAVFFRPADDTYWSVIYIVSSDGELNEFRDGSASEPVRVVPVKREYTEYVPAVEL